MSILDNIIDAFWTDERVGKHGENLTARELKLVNFFGRNGKILRNLYVPKDNGQTSEIDVIYITQKGIFVLESKNYSGWIFGDESSKYWTASLPNGQKNRFYNPIMQNKTHIKWLKNYLSSNGFGDIPMFSLIVFSERCEIKKMSVTSPDVYVIQRESIYATVRNIWNANPDAVQNINQINKVLKKLTNVDKSVKQEHISDIETKCPKCGADLVLRTAKKTGEQFYGCSNFPKCRYTRNLK